jgi:hypothetical protein
MYIYSSAGALVLAYERHRRVEHLRRRLDVVARRQPQVLYRLNLL